MSAPAPLTPDEQRKRDSTRMMIGILAFSGGCGCLILVLAFAGGVVLGFLEHRAQPIPVATPASGDEPPVELRLPQ